MSGMNFTDICSVLSVVISTIGTIVITIIKVGSRKSQREYEKMAHEIKRNTQEIQCGNKVSVATARAQIAQIYNQCRKQQQIEQGLWESVSDLYDAYKSTTINGHTPNSWCDSMVNEMKTWKKV